MFFFVVFRSVHEILGRRFHYTTCISYHFSTSIAIHTQIIIEWNFYNQQQFFAFPLNNDTPYTHTEIKSIKFLLIWEVLSIALSFQTTVIWIYWLTFSTLIYTTTQLRLISFFFLLWRFIFNAKISNEIV